MTVGPIATIQHEKDPNWWRPGKSIQEFHDSAAFVRWLVGARGSAKTASAGMEAIRHAWHNAGAKIIVLRKTEASQADTTIGTLNDLYRGMGPLYEANGGLFESWNNGKTVRLPTRKAVEAFNAAEPTWTSGADRAQWMETEGNRLCAFLEFRGLPDAKQSENRLRGFECSMLILVEADLLTLTDFQMAVPCVGRRKGSDPATCDESGFILEKGIIVETNPPGTKHWIAEIEEEWKNGEHPDYHFWHIRTAENAHNLPPGYVETLQKTYKNNPAMLARMVNGEYADAFEGKPVIYAYSQVDHEFTPERPSQRLGWMHGARMLIGMDVGTNNYSVICGLKRHKGYDYLRAYREIYLTESDTDRQCLELLRVLSDEFPFWNTNGEVCPEALFYCDPAARNSSFTKAGPTSSALAVMQSHGIYPGYKIGVELNPSLALENRVMQQNHVENRQDGPRTVWHFQIDPIGCPLLVRALRGEYRYPTKEEPGYGNDKPLKGELCNHADHKNDGFRYLLVNAFGLDFEMHPDSMKVRNRPHTNPEPARTL